MSDENNCVYVVYNHALSYLIGTSMTLDNAKLLCPVLKTMIDECICVHRVRLDVAYEEDENIALCDDTVVYPL